MKKIIVTGLLIISAPLLGALQQYAGKTFTPNVNVAPSYKFNAPTNHNTNYKFDQSITPTTDYRNYSSFNQQQIGSYKPVVTNQPNMEQARQLMEQAKQSTASSNMMKKYAAARSYSTSNAQQGSSWWNKLLVWLGIGTAVSIATSSNKEEEKPKYSYQQQLKDEKELTTKLTITLEKEQYLTQSPVLEEIRLSLLDDLKTLNKHEPFPKNIKYAINRVLSIVNTYRLILIEHEVANQQDNFHCLGGPLFDPQVIQKCDSLKKLSSKIKAQKDWANGPNMSDITYTILNDPQYNFLVEKFFTSTSLNNFDSKYVELYLEKLKTKNLNKNYWNYLEDINQIKNEIEAPNNYISKFENIRERILVEILLKSCNIQIDGLTNFSSSSNFKENEFYWLKKVGQRQQFQEHKNYLEKQQEAKQNRQREYLFDQGYQRYN